MDDSLPKRLKEEGWSYHHDFFSPVLQVGKDENGRTIYKYFDLDQYKRDMAEQARKEAAEKRSDQPEARGNVSTGQSSAEKEGNGNATHSKDGDDAHGESSEQQSKERSSDSNL